jgi:hypothetical protein
MNCITSRAFQSNYQRLVEPCIVTARSRTLGTWYPKGTEPGAAELEAEIKHLKFLLAERAMQGANVFAPAVAVRSGFNNAPFTPVPK